jgi:hypothetical protein
MAKFVLNTLLLASSLILVFFVIEISSRFLLPISPGARYVTVEGAPIKTISGSANRYQANLKFRQVSDEFDSLTSIDNNGNRFTRPPSEIPEVIFLGDSFTFGHGLTDEQTFSSIYCQKLQISCANLGRNGSGTFVQIDILKHYLDTEGWRPKEVKLFLLAMTSTLMNGNDLLDNYYFTKVRDAADISNTETENRKATAAIKAPTEIYYWLRIRNIALQYSNLARAVYFQFAPMLRVLFSPKPTSETLETALASTKEALEIMAETSIKYGFKYKVYVLHPVQDLMRGSWNETTQNISKLSSKIVPTETAQQFLATPKSYYFSYDGHFNALGASTLANFLLSEEESQVE